MAQSPELHIVACLNNQKFLIIASCWLDKKKFDKIPELLFSASLTSTQNFVELLHSMRVMLFFWKNTHIV